MLKNSETPVPEALFKKVGDPGTSFGNIFFYRTL